MQRLPEPELMTGAQQARAYAEADFSEANSLFLSLFRHHFPNQHPGHVLDLGCGPGDIAIRFAAQYPGCHITGIDGADAMLAFARKNLQCHPDLRHRVDFQLVRLPAPHPILYGDTILSNSLLHHLTKPSVLWQEIKRWGRENAAVLIMDLLRPDSKIKARELVHRYAAGEPAILQGDFYHSLCAAYTEPEIQAQLHQSGLSHFRLAQVSDRHVAVFGRLK